jgi:hypothetical protein
MASSLFAMTRIEAVIDQNLLDIAHRNQASERDFAQLADYNFLAVSYRLDFETISFSVEVFPLPLGP